MNEAIQMVPLLYTTKDRLLFFYTYPCDPTVAQALYNNTLPINVCKLVNCFTKNEQNETLSIYSIIDN